MRAAFHRRVQAALADAKLQTALDNNAVRRLRARLNALASLPDPESTRRRAAAIRRDTVRELDKHLAALRGKLKENGWNVHEAPTADAACRLAIEICHRHGVSRVAKSKSMVTEEIRLNRALGQAGIEAVETDLGEYIVQLRGEPPAHIISPCVHLTRQDVGALFEARLGIPYTDDVAVLNAAARRALRPVFLDTQVGISGANFAIAETGTLVLVTNEGNGRMVTHMPPVHIAFVGVERVVPTLADLPPLLELLPRSGSGQKLTSYVSLLQAPRASHDADGPVERHVILVENGRHRLAASNLQDSLACIRCGACLNACPVFREIGGHAYASPYPGPIGSVVSPGMLSLAWYGHLAKASSLCGACREACPVDIDLPSMLLRLRREYVRAAPQVWWLRPAMRLFAWTSSNPRRFSLALRLAAWLISFLPTTAGWVRWMPSPLHAWTSIRHFPRFKPRPFRQRVRGMHLSALPPTEPFPLEKPAQSPSRETADLPLTDRFQRELEAIGGEVRRVQVDCLSEALAQAVRDIGATQVILAWPPEGPAPGAGSLETELRRRTGVPALQAVTARSACATVDQAERSVGVTAACAALADSGTIVVASGRLGALDASLLPGSHFAILSARDIHPSLSDWIEHGGGSLVGKRSSVVLITGPSRTADIEMTLTIGVHGPARLIVFLCEGDSPLPGSPA